MSGARIRMSLRAAGVAIALLVLALVLADAAAAGESERCKAPAKGWSLSGATDAGAKRPVWRSVTGLTLCSRFQRKTCCSRAQTDKLYVQWRATLVGGFGARCSAMFETVLCMECDPKVGTGKVERICKSTCEAWFAACRGEFFAAQAVANEAPVPCQEDSLLCSPLEAIAASGVELCAAFGLAIGEDFCYDGSADPDALGEPEKAKREFRAARERTFAESLWDQLTRPSKAVYTTVAIGSLSLAALTVTALGWGRQRQAGPPSGQQLGGAPDGARVSRLLQPDEE